jgi:enamine deaminase RidA (YjgF/YER057c/UK114 family)
MTDTSQAEPLSILHINPPELLPPAGYSHAVDVRGAQRMIFIAGQTALDRDGKLVGRGDFIEQAEQAFRNLGAALKAAGADASNVVKLTVYLRDMKHLASFREVRRHFFPTGTRVAAPAITLIEASRLYGAAFLIEVEAIAVA